MTEKKRRHTRDQSYAEQVNPGLELAADVKKGSKSQRDRASSTVSHPTKKFISDIKDPIAIFKKRRKSGTLVLSDEQLLREEEEKKGNEGVKMSP